MLHFDKSTVNKLVKIFAISGEVFSDSIKKLYTGTGGVENDDRGESGAL